MIRPLRQRHRVMVLSLAMTLPAAFVLGIAMRNEVPTAPAGALGQLAESRSQNVLWTRNDLWEQKPIQTSLLSIGPGSGQLAVELNPAGRIVRPDLLVYWVPAETKIRNSLPDNALLLGSFEQSVPTPLTLHELKGKQTGVLVLYSLADQEIIATSKPFNAR